MERERPGEFDDVRHPPGNGKYVRDDIRPGDEVEIEVFGRRVLAVLSGLSPSGKAIVETLLFHRPVTTELDAASLRKHLAPDRGRRATVRQQGPARPGGLTASPCDKSRPAYHRPSAPRRFAN
jgi:hypothetical protein